MADINQWSAVDDSNNGAAPNGWAEGQMPSTVNNCARAMMGSLKRWRDQSQPTVTATGSGNAQIITYPVAPAALANGDTFCFFALGNTGAATLQVNAQAAKAVRTSVGTALIGGEMPAGAAIMVVYDGTNFRMLAAPTPLSVANGGTGATTPGTAADAIGAVKDTGDTMTGELAVPIISYTTHPGHGFAFSWDGAATHVWVDGVDTGVIGDISSVTAGNGLTGGGSTGALTLAMSGSYTGNFSVGGSGLYGGYVNSSGNIDVGAQISGNTVVANGITSNGNINANGSITAGSFGATGNISANGQLSCGGRFYAAGDYGSGNPALYVTNEIWCARHVIPQSNGGTACGLSAYGWSSVQSFVYYTSSDPALKRDIASVPDGCLELVAAIEPKTYKLNLEADEGRTHWGFMAPEVGQVMAQAGLKFDGVRTEGDAPSSLDYNSMIAILWKACREMAARLKQLEER